jgi:hypothetical protein
MAQIPIKHHYYIVVLGCMVLTLCYIFISSKNFETTIDSEGELPGIAVAHFWLIACVLCYTSTKYVILHIFQCIYRLFRMIVRCIFFCFTCDPVFCFKCKTVVVTSETEVTEENLVSIFFINMVIYNMLLVIIIYEWVTCMLFEELDLT